jgi:hypothetical protein
MRARTIRGEAFKTQRSATADFLDNFIGVVLERRDAKPGQGCQELGYGDPSDFCRLRLRDETHFVPFDRRSQAHLAHKVIRVLPQCRKDCPGQFRNARSCLELNGGIPPLNAYLF